MSTRSLTAGLVLVTALSACNRGAPSGSLSVAGGAVRRPTFRYVKEKEGGCNEVFFHKGSADDREVLWISADKKQLQLPARGSRTFDLALSPPGLMVAVDLWEAAPRFRAYCNDISPDTRKQATWQARTGKVTITLGEPVDPEGTVPRRYRASVRLEGVVFEDEAGHRVTLPKEAITDVVVGWYAG